MKICFDCCINHNHLIKRLMPLSAQILFTPVVDIPHRYQPVYGPRREKTCLRGFGNNTGADQPAHPRSLISAFVIRFLESTKSRRQVFL